MLSTLFSLSCDAYGQYWWVFLYFLRSLGVVPFPPPCPIIPIILIIILLFLGNLSSNFSLSYHVPITDELCVCWYACVWVWCLCVLAMCVCVCVGMGFSIYWTISDTGWPLVYLYGSLVVCLCMCLSCVYSSVYSRTVSVWVLYNLFVSWVSVSCLHVALVEVVYVCVLEYYCVLVGVSR